MEAENICLTINDYIELEKGVRSPYVAISSTDLVQKGDAVVKEKASKTLDAVQSKSTTHRSKTITYEDEILYESYSAHHNSHSLPPGKKYHVFFSHSSEDREWVFRMVTKLESNYGFKCCFADRDFDLGAPVFENITKCINLSKKTVIVLTPEFLESSWCSYETRITMEMDLDTRQRLLVPVMLRNCKVPEFIGRLSYIEADNDHFLEPFIKALKDESSDSPINEVVGSASLISGTPFQFNPNFFNTEEICEVTVYVGCSNCSESPAEFIPNELLRHGLQLTVEDYKAVLNIISRIWYIRCHGCYNRVPYWISFLCLQGVFAYVSVLLCASHESLQYAFRITIFMLMLFINLGIAFFRLLTIIKGIRNLSEAISAANKIAIKSNMLVSVKEYGCCYCACNRIAIIFMYYEWRPCQSYLRTLLLEMASSSVGLNEKKVESQDVERIGLTESETESLSMSQEELDQLETRVEDLLLYHATEYGQLVLSRRTRNPNGQRHTRQKECLCQFAESILLSRKSSCLGRLYGGQIRHPWRRIIEF